MEKMRKQSFYRYSVLVSAGICTLPFMLMSASAYEVDIAVNTVPANETELSVTVQTPGDQLPDIARAMIDAAVKTGEIAEINAVAKAATSVFPDSAENIQQYRDYFLSKLETEKIEAAAAEKKAKEAGGFFAVSPWEGKLVGSAARATGNAQNTAYGFLLDANRSVGKFTHNVAASLDIASSSPITGADSVLTQRRWALAYKLDYALNDRTYAFGRFAYEEDQFSGFDYRLFGGAGIGYQVVVSDAFNWAVEAGPGYRYSLIDDTDETTSQFAFYASSDTDWLIREWLLFEQNFDFTWTSATTTFESLTALSTKLTNQLSLGASYLVRHETSPPLGRLNTDTLLRASITYGF